MSHFRTLPDAERKLIEWHNQIDRERQLPWWKRRWICLKHGHVWNFPSHGPDYCRRCGRLVEW